MKDFYDLWYLGRNFPFEGRSLTQAIASTFARRETDLPSSPPDALTITFARDEQKQQQWSAFLRRTRLDTSKPDLVEVIEKIKSFLWPPLSAAEEKPEFDQKWLPGGPWKQT